MNNDKKIKIFKIVALILVIVLLIILTIVLFPLFANLTSDQGRIDFKNNIESLGIWGPFVVGGLMMLQMVVAFLPGEPLEFIAGMCYGTWGGLLVMFIASFVGSAIIFFIVRKVGRSFIYSFFSKEKVEKIENSKLLQNKEKLYIILFILFFIPGTPKDLFVYIGGLLPISPIKFLSLVTFARFPSIITSTFAGSNLVDGNIWLMVITYIITFVVSGILILIAHLINKKHNYMEV